VTAVRKGLDGTDAVVTHPASGNDSAAAHKIKRPERAHLLANSAQAFAASDQRDRTSTSRLPKPRAACEENSLKTHMLYSVENHNTNSTALLILHYR
jgi:hypothetical protein